MKHELTEVQTKALARLRAKSERLGENPVLAPSGIRLSTLRALERRGYLTLDVRVTTKARRGGTLWGRLSGAHIVTQKQKWVTLSDLPAEDV